MKIVVLNGNPQDGNPEFNAYLERLKAVIEAKQNTVTIFPLASMNLHNCVGCFGCWVKTPGECLIKDDSETISRAVIQSDFLLWASPLRMGFPSAELKRAMDRSIPLIHPYFAVDFGEAHHKKRYPKYPRVGLLLEKEAATDAGDVRIVTDIYSRTAVNMKSRLEFSLFTDTPVEQVAAAISDAKQTEILFERNQKALPGVHAAPFASLTLINGSLRAKSNTRMFFEQIARGFESVEGHSSRIVELRDLKTASEMRDLFAGSACVLLGFPLYTDAMPGVVKSFIEALEPLAGKEGNPPIAFMVHSGFPEGAHSRHVERYLEKLARRLGSPYLGTIVKGGSEGMQTMPPQMTDKPYAALAQLGSDLAQTGGFDPQHLKAVVGTEKYPAVAIPLFKLLSKTSLLSFYWDGQLKQNGIYEQRFAQPYLEKEV